MNKKDIKIIFMGSPEFAVPSLEILINNGYSIPAVVTVPDKPKGRGLKVIESDIKKYALSKGIPVLQPEKLRDDEFLNAIDEINPDLIVVVAFRILPKELYTKARLGSFNLHGSLLPKYRGAAPINRAIMNGDTKTGVTTFFLEDKVDTGNIIFTEEIPISSVDTAGDIHDKLSVIGAELVLKTVEAIISGSAPRNIQNETESSPAPKIFKEDCKINWNMPAEKIHNLIRGLSPYPTAYTIYDGKIVKIYRSEVSDEVSGLKPGSIIINKDQLFAASTDKLLKVVELQLEGKKRLPADEFLRGFRFKELSHFE